MIGHDEINIGRLQGGKHNGNIGIMQINGFDGINQTGVKRSGGYDIDRTADGFINGLIERKGMGSIVNQVRYCAKLLWHR